MKLPNIDKNAYLSIFLRNQTIYANLAYVDYTSGRNYVLSDITYIHNDEEIVYSSEFWNEYFSKLSEKFNWEIISNKNVVMISAEGVGVGAVTVHISGHSFDVDKVISHVREVSFEISFKVVNQDYIRRVLDGISPKLGYDDVVYINLDLFDFDIFRVSKEGGPKLLNAPSNIPSNYQSAAIRWPKKENLVTNIHNSRFRAFFSHEVSTQKISNTWANYVSNPVYFKSNPLVQDLIRSYITVQLLSILNDNGKKFENIGSTGNSTLVVLSGGLLSVLDPQELYVSLIDGLELMGECDLLFDKKGTFLSFGRNLVEGIESSEFIFSNNDVFNRVRKLVVAQSQVSKSRKVIFTGKLESSSQGEKEIFAFSPELSVIELNNKKEFVTGKFVQGALWGNKYQTFELYSDPRSVTYLELIIDGRPKPVVYGPDPRSNRFKLSGWINENN